MKILLTGDDGYNSIGIRLLCQSLREHTLVIVGTRDQQTGMGGKISVREGGTFVETTVDGIPAFALSGTPADAMEFAAAHFKEEFDYLISGVNMGDNVTSSIISSGTVSAVFRGMGLRLAKRALALSWSTPPEFFFKKHDDQEELEPYLEHPGKNISEVLQLIFSTPSLSARFLNINIPSQRAPSTRFTRIETDARSAYPPLHIDYDDRKYAYPFSSLDRKANNKDTDIATLSQNAISITPVLLDWTDLELYRQWSKKEDL